MTADSYPKSTKKQAMEAIRQMLGKMTMADEFEPNDHAARLRSDLAKAHAQYAEAMYAQGNWDAAKGHAERAMVILEGN